MATGPACEWNTYGQTTMLQMSRSRTEERSDIDGWAPLYPA
jgi:hypothetical protein